ncbi:MAG: hypothetical protein EOP68_11100 [Sphingomonas sp.]|nr:MAG: hypothetical protein EOP68_11100 [Sphingomonas sp.]
MMRRPLTPVWLATPSRFANISQPAARTIVALLALLLTVALATLSGPAVPLDTAFYATIVEGVRHGGNFYTVTADALRAGGYPLAPFATFRLPTAAVIQAALPNLVVEVLLYFLTAAVAVAWYGRLGTAVRATQARTAIVILLVASLAPMLRPGFAALPDLWAGLTIALSLAVRRQGRSLDAIAFGMAAALLRETAILYLLVMLAFALAEHRRREAMGWGVALVVVIAVLAVHAYAVAGVVKPLDDLLFDWTGMLGMGAFVSAAASATALAWLPLWSAAPIVGLALFGWATWRDPVASRALATIVATAALIGVFGRDDTPHWVMLVTPLLLSGLVFVPDGLRDLTYAALDSRRITVTRVIR